VDDPLGGMLVTSQGFGDLARRVVEVAENSADGRVVAVLEGGYDPPALGASVAVTLAALDGNNASLRGTPERQRGRNGDATS
jgi:acetoin utilization deacetylase AcuC-like enzyme